MALRLREHLACSQVLSSLPTTLQAILVLLVTLVFDIWRVGDLLWRINKMISRAAHPKGAVWGIQGTLQGMSTPIAPKTGPLLKRGGRPFSCALVLASTPVGCRRPGKWSAVRSCPFLQQQVSALENTHTANTYSTEPGRTRAVSTSFYSFLWFPISPRLTPQQPPCAASRARTLTTTFNKQ